MGYLGLYKHDKCFRYVSIREGDVVDAHVRLLLKMIEGSGSLELRTTEKRPTLEKAAK